MPWEIIKPVAQPQYRRATEPTLKVERTGRLRLNTAAVLALGGKGSFVTFRRNTETGEIALCPSRVKSANTRKLSVAGHGGGFLSVSGWRLPFSQDLVFVGAPNAEGWLVFDPSVGRAPQKSRSALEKILTQATSERSPEAVTA